MTPLIGSLYHDENLTKLLLDNGSNVNEIKGDKTPLDIALENNNPATIKLLKERGGKKFDRDGYVSPELLLALDKKKYSDEIWVRTQQKMPPHEYDIFVRENAELSGEQIRIIFKKKKQERQKEAEREYVEVVSEIIQKNPRSVNLRDADGNTPLHLATILERKALVILLIDNGAEVDIINNIGKTPLQIAKEINNDELSTILVDHGATE